MRTFPMTILIIPNPEKSRGSCNDLLAKAIGLLSKYVRCQFPTFLSHFHPPDHYLGEYENQSCPGTGGADGCLPGGAEPGRRPRCFRPDRRALSIAHLRFGLQC